MMSPERFKLVEEVFQAAVGLDPGSRRDFVIGRCGADAELREKVFALLGHHDSGGIEPGGEFARAVRSAADSAFSESAPDSIPSRIGSYRILRPLGEGGFGMVYLAQQDHPRRTVALKLLRTAFASGEVARRFEYEARILARLRHPGIAQIYEAGSAETRVTDASGGVVIMRQPFLALEYVEGPNLVNFVLGDAGSRPVLPIRDRLALFALVCDALQHAHQNGVIHRDLKPDNILVSCDAPVEPCSGPELRTPHSTRLVQPKLLDFGVARVMDADPDLTLAQTVAGRMIGTLAYMSPEQIAGNTGSIDTRSDIYAMGVLLYQVLSGRLPYEVRDVPLDQAIRIVREREPAPIHSLDRALRADALAVIQKAMAKDRERRYASVAEFAADVRRLLSGEPVAAKGNSRWYVLTKTVRRHRVALAVASAFVLVLALSSVMGWMLYVSAQRARDHSAALLRDSYLNQARATREGDGIGRRLVATELLKEAARLRMGHDLRSEAIAALCVSDFHTLRKFPPGWASARGLSHIDRLALIDVDRSIRIVSVESGQDICHIPGREVPPSRVRFSASGEYLGALYIAEGQTTVAIWSLPAVQPILLRTTSRIPVDFAFGDTSGKPWVALPLAETEPRGALDLLSLPSGERIATFSTGVGNPWYIVASPDGSRLAAVSSLGKELEILDASDGRRLFAWSSDHLLRSPCWSPDGRTVGVGADDSRVHFWNAMTGESLPPLEGHRATVADLAVGAEMIASAGWDGTVRIWDSRAKAELFSPLPGTELVGFDGSRLAISEIDGVRVLVHSDDSPRRILHAQGPMGAEASVDFCPGTPIMAVAGNCGVQLWDTRKWNSVTLTDQDARNAICTRDGRTLLALVGKELRRWDIRAAWESTAGSTASEEVWSGGPTPWASLHPDGTGVVVSARGRIQRVDLGTGAVTDIAKVSPDTERPVIDATGRWLFLGTWRGAPAIVMDLRNGTTALTLDESSVRGVFSPDGSLLSVGLPSRHQVFDAGQWNSPREFQGREPGLSSVAGASTVAQGDALMAYVEPPHIVRLADPHTATILATLPNPERFGIPEVRFSPDGRLAVVLTLDDTIIVWSLDRLREELDQLEMEW